MAHLDELLHMLQSPIPRTRLRACTELSSTDRTSKKVILALEKAVEDNDEAVSAAAGHALHAEIHQEMYRVLFLKTAERKESSEGKEIRQQERTKIKTKICPYCAEDIKEAAIVCKHCGRDLDPEVVASVTHGLKQESTRVEAPEDKAESLERKPLWISAMGWGAILAGFYLVYQLVQYSQGRMGNAEFGGAVIISTLIFFMAGTAIGFILVSLWRWIDSRVLRF